jgi:chromosome condensin MukBEF complex kleisin-like MukF subunit
MTQEDKDKALTYFTLCQAMIHIIEDVWKGNPANKQRVKSITNQQLTELEKVVEILLPKGDYSEKGMKVTEQFIEAAEAMLFFYKIGVQMSRLDDTKRETLNTQMNILLKSYEING